MHRLISFLSISIVTLSFGVFFQAPAKADMIEILDDHELAGIQAKGFYFRVDLSLEAFTDAATAPQVVINQTEPFIQEYGTGDGGGGLGGGGNINLSGAAQGNLNALINIIGANSVINVGLNIINIQNSTNDYITLGNTNTGTLAGISSAR